MFYPAFDGHPLKYKLNLALINLVDVTDTMPGQSWMFFLIFQALESFGK